MSPPTEMRRRRRCLALNERRVQAEERGDDGGKGVNEGAWGWRKGGVCGGA